MAFIDNTVVTVALPVVQTNLNAGVHEAQWIVEAYGLFLASLMLVGGSLGDYYGRRRIYAIGIALFALASLWCGLAETPEWLIYGRAIQGVGGALLVPGSLAIITANFAPHLRGRAIGIWSGFTAITTALGPVIGGYLVQTTSWRWIFFINIPLAIATLIILLWRVPEYRTNESAPRLDWLGALLGTIALSGVVFGLIESGIKGMGHPLVIGSIAVGLSAMVAFVFVELYSAAPMMPLTLFRSRDFSGANLLTLFLYAGFYGTLFIMPFNFIQVQGYSPLQAGAAFLPAVLIVFMIARWAGNLTALYGGKLPLVVGTLIAAVGFALFARTGLDGRYWADYFPAVVIMGLGMAISVPPLTTVVMGAVESHQAGLASGVSNTVSHTAGLLAVAVMGVVVLSVFNHNLNLQLATLELSPDIIELLDAERIKLAAAEVPQSMDVGLKLRVERAIDQAFIAGFRRVMIVASLLAVASALVAALMVSGQQKTQA